MTPPITITCNLTDADNRAFRRYGMFGHYKIHWFAAALMIGLITLVWFSIEPGTPLVGKIAIVVITMIMWGGISFILISVWMLIMRFTGKRFRGSVGPHTYEISDDTFTAQHAESRQELRMAGLRRVVETKSYFFVITNSGMGYVVPKRELQSCDPMRELGRKILELAPK